MALHMSRLGRQLGFLLLGIGVGLCVGCSSPKAPLPPGGTLREGTERTEIKSPAADEYILHAGDEIDIQVYREPELSGTFRVKPSGKIRHPLVGSVKVEGKTVKEAEAYFTKRLAKDYLVNPRVILKMISTQSSQIVLLGEVKEPGVYPLPFGEGMTLLQAIAGAGGFTDLASPPARIASGLCAKGRMENRPLNGCGFPIYSAAESRRTFLWSPMMSSWSLKWSFEEEFRLSAVRL